MKNGVLFLYTGEVLDITIQNIDDVIQYLGCGIEESTLSGGYTLFFNSEIPEDDATYKSEFGIPGNIIIAKPSSIELKFVELNDEDIEFIKDNIRNISVSN